LGVEIGIFDIKQVDPTDPGSHAEVYARRLRDLELADRLGLCYAFTAERHFMGQYRSPAPTAWLAAASQRTSSIRLGVLAYTLPLHQPAALAEEVAVLDHLSNGRIEVGLGLGHRAEELAAIGIDPADRIRSFQERFAVMQALWGGSVVTLETDLTTVRGIAINPLPVQKPMPPLWYAGGDESAAEWAAEKGMSLALGFKPASALSPSTSAFRRALKRHRRSAPNGETAPRAGRIALMRHVYVAETDEAALSEMSADLYRLHAPAGPAEGSRSDRKEDAVDAARKLIADEIFFAGSPATIARAILLEKARLGINVFLANIYSAGVEDERIHRMLSRLASEVAPQLTTTGAKGG
jgi:alkanesulfonate monooxygenase SsuD/methylene tetrahydromethanopterin reductase-like flavin-dependent oxidoreductase (luciferase family)